MANSIRIRRGVAANLATLASGNNLSAGELYLISDQNRLSVGLSANTHAPHALLSEVQAKQDTLVSGTNVKTVNGNSLLGSGDLTIVGGGGGTPGGTTGQLQYNNAGNFGGAANVRIDVGDLILSQNYSPAAALASSIRLFCAPVGGELSLGYKDSGGIAQSVQNSIARNKIAWWNPPGNATTVPGVLGISAPTAVGTATTRSVAATNIATRLRRLGYVSSTTAGTLCGHYVTAAQFTTGNGSGLGGFKYVCRFVISDATVQSVARMFVGLSSSVAAPTNVSPGTLTNCMGVGHIEGATNLSFFSGGSAAQTPISLGASFPIANNTAYELVIFASPVQSGIIGWMVTNLSTGLWYEGISGDTTAAKLPLSTTLLAHRAWRTNNSAAAAVGLDIASVYLETND